MSSCLLANGDIEDAELIDKAADLIERQQVEINKMHQKTVTLNGVVESYQSKRMYQVLVEERQLSDQAARKANDKVREQQAEIERLRAAMFGARDEIEKYGSYAKALEILQNTLKGATTNETDTDN